MAAAPRVDIFHIGPQKSGTTWVYECLLEHPDVCCPPKDTIHYYDMFYARGPEWYAKSFTSARPGQKLLDPTPSYLRSAWAPRRMAADNPEAKIIICLRDPIERAFSHYWHEKKKLTISFDFADVLKNYDLFQSYLEPGFYAEHIERFLNYYPKDSILMQRFEHLQKDPEEFLGELLRFTGLMEDFEPSILHRKRNAASPSQTVFRRLVGEATEKSMQILPDSIATGVQNTSAYRLLSGRREYLDGVPAELYRQLLEICEPEISRLEDLLDIRLDEWKQMPSGS